MSTGRKRSLSGPACSSPAKRKKYLCKYQKAWEAEFSWLSHSDRSVNDGDHSIVRRSITQKAHQSEGPLVRRFISPMVRQSEGSLVRRSVSPNFLRSVNFVFRSMDMYRTVLNWFIIQSFIKLSKRSKILIFTS